MNTPYPVIEIAPEWVKDREQMGSKDKFWFRRTEATIKRDWLFKYPTPDTGQHWAEKIAYEIALEMGLRLTPRVELAMLQGEPGSATLNFVTKDSGYELFHGNQILAGMDAGYDPEKRYGQKLHTVERIFASMHTFPDTNFADKCRRSLAFYLVLDAIICNVDRHHENWGILRKRDKEQWRGRLAPTYDHASSLGHNLKDQGGKQNRERYLNELGVSKYVERGHGAIFVDLESKKAPSPLNLVRYCLSEAQYAPYFQPALHRVAALKRENVEAIVTRIPETWMSPLTRKFAIELILYNVSELNQLNT
jgi:hypothetical protein